MRIASPGHAIFVATTIALGIMGSACLLVTSPAATATQSATLLDAFLPASHFRNAQSVRIMAPPSVVFASIHAVTPNEVRGFAPFVIAIHAPSFQLTGRERALLSRPMLEAMREEDFVLLGERGGEEIVVGGIGQYWANRYVRLRSAGGFSRFRDPRFARIAMNVRVRGDGNGGSWVSTETRVLCPDLQARRKFEAWWRLWTPGGCVVRTQWLEAVRRRAERQHRR